MSLAESRRRVLLGSAAAVLAPFRARADTAVPTFSLKGLPGLSKPAPICSGDDCSGFEESSSLSLPNPFGGKDDPTPLDLGIYGRGTADNPKSGRLNKCEDLNAKDGAKKGCISTFDDPQLDSYVPPWTYQAGYSQQVLSPSEARRQALRAEAGLPPTVEAAPLKTREAALAELKGAVEAAGGKIVVAEDRYLRAEFTDGGVVDDVEWLLSLDQPLCGYRSAARRGGDDQRQRNRIRDIRKSLTEKGWKSVGRLLEGI